MFNFHASLPAGLLYTFFVAVNVYSLYVVPFQMGASNASISAIMSGYPAKTCVSASGVL